MTNPSRTRLSTRAPRVNFWGSVSATIQLENGRLLPAKLHRVSVTGGLLELANYMEERISVGLTLPVGSGVVHAPAQMLFPMRGVNGYLQPFRFTDIRAEQLHILDREITTLLSQTTASATNRPVLGSRPPQSLLESL